MAAISWNRSLRRLCVLLVALVLGSAVWGGRTWAGGAPSVQVLPPSVHLESVGESTPLDVYLEGVEGIYGLDVRLSFDPEIVTVPAGRVTPLWEVFDPYNHFVVKNEVNNEAGTIWYAVTNINPAEPFSGGGRVCSIVFQGEAEGISDITFTYAKGSDRDGTAIWPEPQGGLIAVGDVQTGSVAVWLPLVVSNEQEEASAVGRP